MSEWLSSFSLVFLGIFVEAVPFLLLGSLASGLLEVFIAPQTLARWFPRDRWGGVLAGSLLGMFLPVGECGVIPLARRLARKGLPVPGAISFLLAAPLINPIAIASTLAAFGLGTIFWGRIGLSLLVAVITGLVFSLEDRPDSLLRVPQDTNRKDPPQSNPRGRLHQALLIAGEEFFEMGRYLILGALISAILQTVIPRTALTGPGQGSFLAAPGMMALAALLSIGSAVDSFVALAFVGTFSAGSILAFLVYGAMVDIKSISMFQRVFRPKTVVYLVVLPFLLTAVATGAFAVLGGG